MPEACRRQTRFVYECPLPGGSIAERCCSTQHRPRVVSCLRQHQRSILSVKIAPHLTTFSRYTWTGSAPDCTPAHRHPKPPFHSRQKGSKGKKKKRAPWVQNPLVYSFSLHPLGVNYCGCLETSLVANSLSGRSLLRSPGRVARSKFSPWAFTTAVVWRQGL